MAEVRVAKVNSTARTPANPKVKAKVGKPARASPMLPALILAKARARVMDTVMVRNSASIARAASGTSESVSRIASATSPVMARKARAIPVMPRSPASRRRNARWAHRNLLKASWK